MYRTGYSYSMPKSYHPAPQPKVYPEDIECIIRSNNPDLGSLYISNVEAASNPKTLKKLNVRAVLTCAKGHQLNHSKAVLDHYKYIAALDHDACDISVHFEEAIDFIKHTLAKTNLVVHCIAGVSRSVSMVIAYLMRERNLSYEDAYSLVKSRRKIIHPNDGFIRQLKEYGNKIKRSKSVDVGQMKNAPKKAVESKGMTHSKSSAAAPEPVFQRYKSVENPIKSYPRKPEYTGYTPYWRQPTYHLDAYRTQRDTTPTKAEQVKMQDKMMTMTHSDFFTPTKQHAREKSDNIQNYSMHSQSVKLDRSTTPGVRKVYEAVSPVKYDQHEVKTVESHSKAAATMSLMNSQLNQKIEQIRKKYEKQREKLFSKYEHADRTAHSPLRTNPEQATVTPKKASEGYKEQYDRLERGLTAKGDTRGGYLGFTDRKTALFEQRYSREYEPRSRMRHFDNTIKDSIAHMSNNYVGKEASGYNPLLNYKTSYDRYGHNRGSYLDYGMRRY